MNRSDLVRFIKKQRSFLCVGLDPDVEKLPKHLLDQEDAIVQFNKAIIAATSPYCVAYKPNFAFYEALGSKGWAILEETIQLIPNTHFIIADAKRGDIGNTSRKYASAVFESLACDAITIAPYMGIDSVQPFLEFEDKWAVVLGLTSNKGSQDFQIKQLAGGQALFEQVLQTVAGWGSIDQIMFVIGATHPQQFERIREIIPDHFLLVPGIGAQGGDLHAVCKYGLNKDYGLLINSSRSIIYAGDGEDFAVKAAEAAKALQLEMQTYFE